MRPSSLQLSDSDTERPTEHPVSGSGRASSGEVPPVVARSLIRGRKGNPLGSQKVETALMISAKIECTGIESLAPVLSCLICRRDGAPSCVTTHRTSPPWTCSLFQPLARRECVDHIVVLGETHLRRDPARVRTHRSLDQDAPVSRPVQQSDALCRTPWLAGCITNTSGFRFSARTASEGKKSRPLITPACSAPSQ
jgi:hypothetical protein